MEYIIKKKESKKFNGKDIVDVTKYNVYSKSKSFSVSTLLSCIFLHSITYWIIEFSFFENVSITFMVLYGFFGMIVTSILAVVGSYYGKTIDYDFEKSFEERKYAENYIKYKQMKEDEL